MAANASRSPSSSKTCPVLICPHQPDGGNGSLRERMERWIWLTPSGARHPAAPRTAANASRSPSPDKTHTVLICPHRSDGGMSPREAAEGTMDLADAEWRTSSRSSDNGGNCVEVAVVDARYTERLPLCPDRSDRGGGSR